MRLLFRFIAILDGISLIFLGMQLWETAKHYNELPDQLSVKIQAILMFPMFLLVLIGAIKLFQINKWGFILYYFQFPFRLYLYVFSVGFITLLPEALGDYRDKWPYILLKVCIVAEFLRLYLTIKEHVRKSEG